MNLKIHQLLRRYNLLETQKYGKIIYPIIAFIAFTGTLITFYLIVMLIGGEY